MSFRQVLFLLEEWVWFYSSPSGNALRLPKEKQKLQNPLEKVQMQILWLNKTEIRKNSLLINAYFYLFLYVKSGSIQPITYFCDTLNRCIKSVQIWNALFYNHIFYFQYLCHWKLRMQTLWLLHTWVDLRMPLFVSQRSNNCGRCWRLTQKPIN